MKTPLINFLKTTFLAATISTGAAHAVQPDSGHAPPKKKKPDYEEQSAPQAPPEHEFEIKISRDTSLAFSDRREYLNFLADLDITKLTLGSYNGQKVPDDLRQGAFLAAKIKGVDPKVLYMIAQRESGFDPDNINDDSTARGYYHLLRNTAYDNMRKLHDEGFERIFPLANRIREGQYRNGGTKLYLAKSSASDIENRRLTDLHHERVAGDALRDSIMALNKIMDDCNLLSRYKIKEPTEIDIYAMWFMGSGGGLKFNTGRRRTPNEPIWKIYGDTLDEARKNGGGAMSITSQRGFYFNEDGSYKTFKQTEDFLKKVKKLTDTKIEFFEGDRSFLDHIKVKQRPLSEVQASAEPVESPDLV